MWKKYNHIIGRILLEFGTKRVVNFIMRVQVASVYLGLQFNSRITRSRKGPSKQNLKKCK